MISYVLHACDVRGLTPLYTFPTDTHVSDFSSARLGPAFDASPYLQSIIVEGRQAGTRKRGAERITLKRIRNRFLYLRGSKVKPDGKAPQLKSIDADIWVGDEIDEMDQRAIAISHERLGHSEVKEERMISTPSYAGVGIDALWQESDQREWFIRCRHCGQWQFMTIDHVVIEWDELERPRVWHGRDESRAYAACKKCDRELDRLSPGQWVARHPGRELVGYHPTRFSSPFTELIDLVTALDTTNETKRRETINQGLGEVYIPKGGQITDEILDSCKREYLHGPVLGESTWAGVDVGKVLHMIVRGPQHPETGERPQRFAAEVDTFDEVGRIMRRFNVQTCVVDALPETRAARSFQDSQPPGRVWLAYYPDSDRGIKDAGMIRWNEEEYTVLMDRTRTLDETYSGFYMCKRTLPANARDIPDYYDHLKVLVRVLVDKKNGQKVAIYVAGNRPGEGGKKPDHWAHAENYCTAAEKAPKVATATSSRAVPAEQLGF